MKIRLKLLLLLPVIFLTLVALYSNCGLQGTSTGNPFAASFALNDESVVSSICKVYSRCFGLNQNTCVVELSLASNLTSAFNLNVQQFPNFVAVKEAVGTGILKVQTTAQYQCSLAITSQSCTSQVVLSSYNQALPSNFNNTYLMLQLSPSCAQIYQ